MLTFKCKTCEREYPAHLSLSKIVYEEGNKRQNLGNENDDCENCSLIVNQRAEEAKIQAREELKPKTKIL